MLPLVLYVDADFGGESVGFSAGPHNVTEFGRVGNDRASSLKIGPHTRATLFVNTAGFGPKYVRENPSSTILEIPYIGDDWNDIVSSVLVESLPAPGFGNNQTPSNTTENLGGIIIYDLPNYNENGQKMQLKVGDHILAGHSSSSGGRIPVWILERLNNSVSSIKVGKGYYAIFYDREDFNGNQVIIGENTPQLSIEWDNKVSSIRVKPVSVPG